ALGLRVRPQMHVRGIEPTEPRFAVPVLALNPIAGGADEIIVAGLHPLAREGPGVLDLLLSDSSPAWLLGRIVVVGRPAVQHASRAEPLPETRKLLGDWVVRILRILFVIEMIEVSEELIETVNRRQVLVPIAEVVLAELPGGVAERLEELGDRGILRLDPHRGTGHADLAQPAAQHALTQGKRGATRRAALLAIGVGEAHALGSDTVDVGRAIPHHTAAIAGQIPHADVIAEDDQDVGLVIVSWLRHRLPPHVHPRFEPGALRSMGLAAVSSIPGSRRRARRTSRLA